MQEKNNIRDTIITVLLILIILTGVFFRFYNMDWDSEALLHPDEYGLTNTLTRLQIPSSLSEYFNTRISPLSPYNKYDESGNTIQDGPDNTMRWGQLPIIIIRLCAEATGQTGYIELRRMGRYVNAAMDVLSLLLLLYIIGKRLFDRKIALTAVALSSLAVMQIQQAHFMTVDNFAVFFTMLTLWSAVRLSQEEVLHRKSNGRYGFSGHGIRLLVLFGVFLGMAISCKVNLAVLGIILAPAILLNAAELKLNSREDFSRIITLVICCALIAVIAMCFSVRIFQPMTFRCETGNTHFWNFHFNPDWVRSMGVAANESKGIGGGPPSEQWAHRPAVVFAWVNMVFYGMGIPLGICVWVCVITAWILFFRKGSGTIVKRLLIPLFWGTFFFLFMSTRFVKNNRYFLPAYPMLCLVTAWGLVNLIRRSKAGWIPLLVVFAGTAAWAVCYVTTIYGQLNTRVEATYWIYDHIPSLYQLSGTDKEGDSVGFPISSNSEEMLYPDTEWLRGFRTYHAGTVDKLTMPHVKTGSGKEEKVVFTVSIEEIEGSVLGTTTAEAEIGSEERLIEIPLEPVELEAGQTYVIHVKQESGTSLSLRRIRVANENWDESIPIRLEDIDPFGQLYDGTTVENRWYDSNEKRAMFKQRLSEADYLFLPSQRGIWSVCRIPKTYPMTMAYYGALFSGELGFELVAQFQRPFRIGPLTISDYAGTITTDEWPELPVNNRSLLAAEEAFSIYDHAPVWIFKKTDDYDQAKTDAFFDSFDLTGVVIQGPTNAEW